MKYLMLLILPTLLLFSCECEDDIQNIKGNYNLISYAIVDCGDEATTTLTWKGSYNSDETLEVTGRLDIKIFSTFKQKLKFSNRETSDITEKEFVGALIETGNKNEWFAEYAENPFRSGHCDSAAMTIDGNTLVWSFTDDNGCTSIMIWEKD